LLGIARAVCALAAGIACTSGSVERNRAARPLRVLLDITLPKCLSKYEKSLPRQNQRGPALATSS
jgi:hypothetical protein